MAADVVEYGDSGAKNDSSSVSLLFECTTRGSQSQRGCAHAIKWGCGHTEGISGRCYAAACPSLIQARYVKKDGEKDGADDEHTRNYPDQ